MVNQNAQTRLNKVEEIVLKAIDEPWLDWKQGYKDTIL